MSSAKDNVNQLNGIAIIGMSGRFPGAANVNEFWTNLENGVESIHFFTDEELLAAGVDSKQLGNPNYVKAKPVLDGIELFDAAFFRISPLEAEVLDPQQRIFLECAWESLENAGYDPNRYDGRIGVYAGGDLNWYLINNLATNLDVVANVSGLSLITSIDSNYMATRVSYQLNLRGPSITVQTACSTSLVAIHLASESLLNGECDMALAGACSIMVPQNTGYLYEPGATSSPDGHCRAFDEEGRGTLFGSGVGIVVLKRLADAIDDGDNILAVIKGSAVNNDGSMKIGFMAPSVDGQAAAISEAINMAEIDPETINYIETHGTGTELGDPIEISALTQAFRQWTEKKGFCAIGSVKTNIGHLACASGVTSLIKTVQALKHKMLPPSLNYRRGNPKIDFDNSPFFVNTALREWAALDNGIPRRAGVSSFGMGGTNVHLIVEEFTKTGVSDPSRSWQLLVLSAKTKPALDKVTDNLADYLKKQPGVNFADVAYTLLMGRQTFEYRRAFACRDAGEAVEILGVPNPLNVFNGFQEAGNRPVAFLFSGLGSHYPNMAREIYQSEPVFRSIIDKCCDILKPHLGIDLREVLFPAAGLGDEQPAEHKTAGIDMLKMLHRPEEGEDAATRLLNQTRYAHPAIFIVEYALARLLMKWGIKPQAMIGHSIGEYVAACIAGVYTLEDALTLVATRAKMIQELPGGAMLAVPLSEEEVKPFLDGQISLSAVNTPSLCLLAGSEEAVIKVQNTLLERDIACRRVPSSHAFHSHTLERIVEPLTNLVKTFQLKPPAIPYVSNITGTWIKDSEATDPRYWGAHTRRTVRFSNGIGEIWSNPDCVLLEIGPGHSLSSLALQHPAANGETHRVISSMRHLYEQFSDIQYLLNMLGQLWIAGVPVDWAAFYQDEQRLRVTLPTYPFERKRYWIEPRKSSPAKIEAWKPAGSRDQSLPEHSRPDLPDGYVAPSNETEEKLVTIWQQLLGVNKVGRNDSFFRLGGHSLVAINMAKRISESFNVEIPLKTTYEAPTIAEMAEYIRKAGNPEGNQGLAKQESAAVNPQNNGLPLSLAQGYIWRVEQSCLGTVPTGNNFLKRKFGRLSQGEASNYRPSNHVFTALRITGALDFEVIEQSINEIIRRHEILRAAFLEKSGEPVQLISPFTDYTLPQTDLSAFSAAEQEIRYETILQKEVERPFDINQGPMFRIGLITLGNETNILFINMHSLIADHPSLNIFIRELLSLYQSRLAGKTAPPAVLPVQYTDYAVWQKNTLKPDTIKNQLAYWRQQLNGSKPLFKVNSKRRQPEIIDRPPAQHSFFFPEPISRGVTGLSQQMDQSLFNIMLSAFYTLLYRCTAQDDIVVCTPVSTRNLAELKQLIGLFGNTVALRIGLAGEIPFGNLTGQVRETVKSAYSHLDVPFEIVLKEFQTGKDAAPLFYSPLAQVMFEIQDETVELGFGPDISLAIIKENHYQIPFDLSLKINTSQTVWEGIFKYNPGLIDEQSITRLEQDLNTLLEGIIADPEQRISQLPCSTMAR